MENITRSLFYPDEWMIGGHFGKPQKTHFLNTYCSILFVWDTRPYKVYIKVNRIFLAVIFIQVYLYCSPRFFSKDDDYSGHL